MIQAIHLVKSFGSQQVIKDVSLTFETGKTNLIIVGQAVVRRSCFKMLVGLIKPDSGKIMGR